MKDGNGHPLAGTCLSIEESSSRPKQGNVLPIEIHLSNLSRSAPDPQSIGLPAHDKETYLAYLAFSAVLFGRRAYEKGLVRLIRLISLISLVRLIRLIRLS